MNQNIKRKHSPDFKTQVVLAQLRADKLTTEICSDFAIHPTQARKWKEQALSGLKQIFIESKKYDSDKDTKDKLIEELYKQVGQLKVELDWLKKKTGHYSSG